MRLSHILFAAVSLLPLTSQAITLDKLGGHWVNTDITCKEDFAKDEICEFFIIPKDKNSGGFRIGSKGKKVGEQAMLALSDDDVWTASYNGEVLLDLEYEDGMLYDGDDKYYRVSN